ncbi:MAG: TonB family protein [Oligoflexales bacterium]|nr:TonB family protein [Oligoflexales bacterium]
MSLELCWQTKNEERRSSLSQPTLKVGSLMSNQVVLDGDGVEPIHALIEEKGGEWWITDLGSQGKLQVNAKPIAIEEKLKAGDKIQIGSVKLQVMKKEEAKVQTNLQKGTEKNKAFEDVSAKQMLAASYLLSYDDTYHQFQNQEKQKDKGSSQEVVQRSSEQTPSAGKERRFLNMLFGPRQVKSVGDVLEVVAHWDDKILEVENFYPQQSKAGVFIPQKVTIGDPTVSHFLAAGPEQFTKHVIAKLRPDGYTLMLRSGMSARVRRDGKLDEFHEGEYILGKKDIAYVQYGNLRYFFVYMRPPVVDFPKASIKDPFLFTLLVFGFGLYALLSLFLLVAEAPSKEAIDNDVWSVVSATEKTEIKKKPEKVNLHEVKKPPPPKEVPPPPKPKLVQKEPPKEVEKPPRPVPKKVEPPKKTESLTKAVTQKPPQQKASPVQTKTVGQPAARFGNGMSGGAIKGAGQISLKGVSGVNNQKSSGVNLSKLGLGVGRVSSKSGAGAIHTQFTSSSGGGGGGSGSAAKTFGLGGISAGHSLGISGALGAASQFGQGPGLLAGGKLGQSFDGAREGAEVGVAAGDPMISGSLSEGEILGSIRVHLNEVRFCYEGLLQRKPGANGKVKMRFVINSTGRVSSVNTESSTIQDNEMKNCLAGAIRKWQFPAPRGGGEVTVNYPFTFSPL